MVTIRQKQEITMKLAAEAVSHSRTDVKVRDVGTTVDEPVERGGTNKGPSPTETLMASLLACTNVITHKVAEKNGVHLDGMSIRLEAQFDRRGVTLQEEVAVPFPKITLYIDVKTGADEAKMAAVKRELNMYCPVSKVLRAAGSKVEEVWTVTRP
jgi:putative redox protein